MAGICYYMKIIEKGIDMKAIGFDLDDTLYNRLTIYEETYRDMQATDDHLDVDFDTFNQVYADFSEEEYQAFMAGEKTEAAFKNDRVIKTYAHFGKSIDQTTAKKFNQLKNHYQEQLTLSEDLVALMEAALSKGMTLFVLTNGSTEAQIDKLANLAVEQFIDRDKWYISESMGGSKPERKVFDQITAELNVASEEILFVGDDYYNDIEGAIQAGWQAIHYAKTEVVDTIATCTTDDFLEMRTLLGNL